MTFFSWPVFPSLGRWRSSRRQPRPTQPRSFRPGIEPLETRLAPAVITDPNPLNTGPGTIDAAIQAINSGDTTLDFEAGPITASLSFTQGLDLKGSVALTGSLTVGGGSSCNGFTFQTGTFDVNGSGNTFTGLTLANATMSLIGGSSVINGLTMTGSSLTVSGDDNTVTNFNCTGSTGGGGGLFITGAANQISTGTVLNTHLAVTGVAGTQNTIVTDVTATHTFTYIEGTDTTVQDSTLDGMTEVGPSASNNIFHHNVIHGDTLYDNGTYSYWALFVQGLNTDIGGPNSGDGNIIYADKAQAILMQHGDYRGSLIQGNYIGTSDAGMTGSGTSIGIQIDAPDNPGNGPANITIRQNVIDSTGVGIELVDAGPGYLIAGNTIGLNAANNPLANGDGIDVSASSQATIGGTTVADRNVISGNTGSGIYLLSGTTGNLIEGNYIGTTPGGTQVRGNGLYGIAVDDSSNNTIGGSNAPGAIAGNVIAGSGYYGIWISGSNGTDNLVKGNFIGTSPNTATLLGNTPTYGGAEVVSGTDKDLGNLSDGVAISGSDNTIGGNVIAFNKGDGVHVTDPGTGNTISEDVIVGNQKLPIELGNKGLNPNTPGVANQDPNQMVNYPIITTSQDASGNGILQGYINGASGQSYTVEIYYSASEVTSGGTPVFLGTEYVTVETVTTDNSGNGTFSIPKPIADSLLAQQNSADAYDFVVSGTVTDNQGNTSEWGVALTPAQIRQAYGLDQLDASLTGAGQTIAIVIPYDDPTIFHDVDEFDQQFGLTNGGPTLYQQFGAASSFLTVVNQNGQPGPLPGVDPGSNGQPAGASEGEAALDVEWAHSIAPGAQIVLVEANSKDVPDLGPAALTASLLPGVSVVSMSYSALEFVTETAQDPNYTTPGVTYLGSTGDNGAPSGYPAFSPNVVAVGGTLLTMNGDGTYQSETGWSGSGGGVSQFELEPAYQLSVQTTGKRTVPDVSLIGGTAVAVMNTYQPGGGTQKAGNPGWEEAIGTSVSTPIWAGLIALVNQGRINAGKAILNAGDPQETLNLLYSLPSTDFHNGLGGANGTTTNGLVAPARYDEVTGLGSPRANVLVPDLIALGTITAVRPKFTSPDSATFTRGKGGSFLITASGATTITLSGALPSGVTFTDNHNGTATLAGTPMTSGTFTLTITARNTSGASTVQTLTLVVATAPTPTPAPSPTPAPTTTTTRYLAVGADAGGSPQVVVYNAQTGALVSSFYAFLPGFTGGVRIAVDDVNGDGVQDIICAAGPGAGPQVVILDGTKLGDVQSDGVIAESAIIDSFYAFAPTFTGGIFLAAGSSSGGDHWIATGAGAGGGPQVVVWDARAILAGGATPLTSFFAFAPGFTGGVSIALGDVNGDGHLDVIAGAGRGAGPQVIVVDGSQLGQIGSNGILPSGALLASFEAFAPNFTGGVWVSGGVTSGSQFNLIIGAGAGAGPQVIVVNGAQVGQVDGKGQIAAGALLDSFFALANGFSGGVRVGFSAGYGTALSPAILTAAGPGGGPQVVPFDGASVQDLGDFFALPQGFSGGLFIAG